MADNPEYRDLVDPLRAPFVRAMGNLAILIAQADGQLFEFIAALHGGDSGCPRIAH